MISHPEVRRRVKLLRRFRRRTQWKLDAVQQFQLSILLLFGLLLVGTSGFIAIEQMTVMESIYMTIITLTTVGFSEVRPLSEAGRLFTIILILLGVSATAYAVRTGAEVVLGDQLWHSLGERDVNKQLASIRDHFIVCGYGRMGREIVRQFTQRGEPFVIIDADIELKPAFLDDHVPYVIGDATRDDVLLAAGIERARGLLAVVNSDADNVLIVLSARGLNRSLKIVARATSDEMEAKLRRAGADNVSSPYVIGGQRMAFALVRPAVYQFLNKVVYDELHHSEMGQIVVREASALVGKTLRDSELRSRSGVIVLAIIDRAGHISISPDASRTLAAGDTLIVVGPTEQLRLLESGSPL